MSNSVEQESPKVVRLADYQSTNRYIDQIPHPRSSIRVGRTIHPDSRHLRVLRRRRRGWSLPTRIAALSLAAMTAMVAITQSGSRVDLNSDPNSENVRERAQIFIDDEMVMRRILGLPQGEKPKLVTDRQYLFRTNQPLNIHEKLYGANILGELPEGEHRGMFVIVDSQTPVDMGPDFAALAGSSVTWCGLSSDQSLSLPNRVVACQSDTPTGAPINSEFFNPETKEWTNMLPPSLVTQNPLP